MMLAMIQDDVRDLIRTKLAERRLSKKEVSEAIGRNHAYLHQFLEQGKPAALDENDRENLASVLHVEPDLLKSKVKMKPPINRPEMVRLPDIAPNDMIPVLGACEGGHDGQMLWNGDTVEHVKRPPQLANVPNGFAIYVVGESMAPRYMPGELVYIHPGRPAAVGDFVLVQLRPASGEPTPRAFVKRLAKRTAAKIVLEQYNPPKTIDVPAAEVVSIQRIVGSGEAR